MSLHHVRSIATAAIPYPFRFASLVLASPRHVRRIATGAIPYPFRFASLVPASPPALPPPQPPATAMWAVRGTTLVLFDVESHDAPVLQSRWRDYQLFARVGPPCECSWGRLDYLDDYRTTP